MNREELYELLDISEPSEFEYYENMASLLESDDEIETGLLSELLSEVDINGFGDILESYFDEFLRVIPDEETDFYVAVENIKRIMLGAVPLEQDTDSINDYASLLDKFRRWYSLENNVINLTDGSDLPVRDARYDIVAADLLGEEARYDFRAAVNFDAGGYDIRMLDIITQADIQDTHETTVDSDQD